MFEILCLQICIITKKENPASASTKLTVELWFNIKANHQHPSSTSNQTVRSTYQFGRILVPINFVLIAHLQFCLGPVVSTFVSFQPLTSLPEILHQKVLAVCPVRQFRW